jgi:hypothetical protein
VNSDPVLIDKLDSKILLLHAKNEQVSPLANILAQQGKNPEIAEYLRLRNQPRIPEALRYTVLAAIAKQYSLYENNQEPKRVSDLTIRSVEQALGWSGLAGVDGLIVGLQIIRSQYRAIYAASAPGLESIEKICLEQVTHKPLAPALNNGVRREFPMTFDYDEERTLLQTELQEHAVLVSKRSLWVAGILLTATVSGVYVGLASGYIPQISINFQPSTSTPMGPPTPSKAPVLPVEKPQVNTTTTVPVDQQPQPPQNLIEASKPAPVATIKSPELDPTQQFERLDPNNIDPVNQSINNLLNSSLITENPGKAVQPRQKKILKEEGTQPFIPEAIN